MPLERIERALREQPRRWAVTGAAGFIGSNLVEALLVRGQRVVGLDNFSSGYRANLAQVRDAVGDAWTRFEFIEGDVRDAQDCARACRGVDVVLHHAALGSVPASIEDPLAAHHNNATGFLQLLIAARNARVSRVVYAASSAAYGDAPGLPKVEDAPGAPLSPYAATKLANELYATAFGRCYGLQTIGLRYFNIFGPRQDPEGAYAAVIPRWIAALARDEAVYIHGDGDSTRDFCHVDNVVQANLLAALVEDPQALGQVYNVALGERTSLNELFELQRRLISEHLPHVARAQPRYVGFRHGDVRHSQADISKARRLLGFAPTLDMAAGLRRSLAWYLAHLAPAPARAVGTGA